MGVKTWGMGSLLHQAGSLDQHNNDEEKTKEEEISVTARNNLMTKEILSHVRQILSQHTLECVLLDRTLSGPSKYRILSINEVADLLPSVHSSSAITLFIHMRPSVMLHRIFGIETEYGLLINEEQPDRPPSWIAYQIIDHLFRTKKHGVLDLHHRGYDEPPGNGGFLLEWRADVCGYGTFGVCLSRMSFPKRSCSFRSSRRLVIAGCDRRVGVSRRVSLIKNNVDHETDATFGCHENYLVSRNFPFSYKGLGKLIPFLVTRQIFTGAGRIGCGENYDGWIPS